ncbi:ECF RNA polymerase sigma factor SigE [Andreprevotia sp. IGB-42]|uniref:RNA polymerase sigma factor n=1 Tax=Andreprevotia sp. IGB-42 TaxID=2497473 RepID=UPI00157E4B96|nr:RNA polymerase sigma factor [Andreprevotia sp. IGB-42]KAF0815340.1 ECF RNA polymerase sigma factor SigE [Andreprevotia sp. IGB-42]
MPYLQHGAVQPPQHNGAKPARLPGMLADLTDETLMQRYQTGDIAAFGELYRRHSQGLYRFIAWQAPRVDWADEIAQDSWASLHKAAGRYQPQAGFRTYLYQIARNRLIDLLRQHQPLLESDLAGAHDVAPHAALDRLAAANDQPTPEAALAEKQRAQRLQAAIRSLPAEQREALVLQQFNGMSLDEIAVLTGAAAETVKSRLRYAMQKLRATLAQDAEGEQA